MLSMLPLRVAIVPVSCSFFKSLFSPRILKFCNKFFVYYCLKRLNFPSKFVAKTHVYTKPF